VVDSNTVAAQHSVCKSNYGSNGRHTQVLVRGMPGDSPESGLLVMGNCGHAIDIRQNPWLLHTVS
jgi:hypothetical protein